MELELPKDFKEFLRLLRAHGVEYLLIGGWAVGYHGYPRATEDLDVWIAIAPAEPVRIEVMTSISGVQFEECYRERLETTLDDEPVSLINLHHLRLNKKASCRFKDLNDLENLPPSPS